jgi:hypothetical protein
MYWLDYTFHLITFVLILYPRHLVAVGAEDDTFPEPAYSLITRNARMCPERRILPYSRHLLHEASAEYILYVYRNLALSWTRIMGQLRHSSKHSWSRMQSNGNHYVPVSLPSGDSPLVSIWNEFMCVVRDPSILCGTSAAVWSKTNIGLLAFRMLFCHLLNASW